MKPVRYVLSAILCLILLSGCTGKEESSRQTVSLETTSVMVTVPAEIQLVDYAKLPVGYEVQVQESGSLQIRENGTVIGAIDIYQIPGPYALSPGGTEAGPVGYDAQ